VNIVCLTGRLAHAPEERRFYPGGEASRVFALAVRRRRVRSGLAEPGVVYVRVVATGGAAAECEGLDRGALVEVWGMLEADVTSDEHGELRGLGSCEILADAVGLADPPSILVEPTRPRGRKKRGR
jgi:single-stranded DNA-binding protein